MNGGTTLDRSGIAALIPHAGRMCLLATVEQWDATTIRCTATSHREIDNPLRTSSGLLASAAIEYAAQAAAVHGGLNARAAGQLPSPGFLASARGVRLHCMHLDPLPGELTIEVEHVAGEGRQWLYGFSVLHNGEPLVDGRLAVVLDTPLPV